MRGCRRGRVEKASTEHMDCTMMETGDELADGFWSCYIGYKTVFGFEVGVWIVVYLKERCWEFAVKSNAVIPTSCFPSFVDTSLAPGEYHLPLVLRKPRGPRRSRVKRSAQNLALGLRMSPEGRSTTRVGAVGEDGELKA